MQGPLGHPAFAFYQGVRFVSVVAIQMMSVAIGWQVYDETSDFLALGLVGPASFWPLFVLSPTAGHAASTIRCRPLPPAG